MIITLLLLIRTAGMMYGQVLYVLSQKPMMPKTVHWYRNSVTFPENQNMKSLISGVRLLKLAITGLAETWQLSLPAVMLSSTSGVLQDTILRDNLQHLYMTSTTAELQNTVNGQKVR